MKLKTLSAADRFTIMNSHITVDEQTKFPRTFMNGCNRSFKASWTKQYPWLVYSKHQDGGYCLPCVLFGQKENLGVLVSRPFTKWTKVSNILKAHENNKYHGDAVIAADDFKRNMQNPLNGIDVAIETQRKQTIAENREIIASIAKCIVVCGRQGIALRGHRDDETCEDNANRGNFYELLKLRVDAGDEKLEKHLKTCAKNARYCSKNVQNELIAVIGNHLRDSIVDEIKDAKFFSILSDEVTDSGNLEQLTMTVRFVDSNSEIREEFMGFKTAERITGEILNV